MSVRLSFARKSSDLFCVAHEQDMDDAALRVGINVQNDVLVVPHVLGVAGIFHPVRMLRTRPGSISAAFASMAIEPDHFGPAIPER